MPAPNQSKAAQTELLAMLRALINGLSASARAVEHQTGITNAQLFLLQELAGGPTSLGELAARARTQASTVSIIVGRLQRSGLVTRERAADDRRRAVIALTADGRAIVARAPLTATHRLLTAVSGLPPQGVRDLIAGLGPLLQRLGLASSDSRLLFEQAGGKPARTAMPRTTGSTLTR